MKEVDKQDIYSVALEPEYCPQCGTELTTRTFDAEDYRWCPSCEMVFKQNALSAVHVVVHDEDNVMVLDEPIPQHEGLWSLPGGFANHDESPREATVRELHEETNLEADPEDLTLVTVYHAETPDVGFHFVTYSLRRSAASGEVVPEAEGFEVQFLPVETVLAATDRIRESDCERIQMALQKGA